MNWLSLCLACCSRMATGLRVLSKGLCLCVENTLKGHPLRFSIYYWLFIQRNTS
jgi:hypothetical protein